MSKYFNPRLLNAVIAGTGMRNPVRPHVILGSEDGEFVRGDLMDANAIQEFINQKISDLVNNAPEALDTLKELADAIQENGVADLVTKGQLEAALDNKVDKIDGKGLSTNDYTDDDKAVVDSLKPAKYNLLDYLFSDGTTGPDLVEGKTPVGICVAPASHFADGKARFMSLQPMKTNNDSTTFAWSSSKDDSGLGKYINITTVDNTGTANGVNFQVWFASKRSGWSNGTMFSSVSLPVSDVYYGTSGNPSAPGPYPFLENGELNPNYNTTRFGVTMLSDVNGKGNTLFLSKKGSQYIAATLCKNFNPGAYNGQWYLPAFGELMYCFALFDDINAKIQNLTLSGFNGVEINPHGLYWSSTESGKETAGFINFSLGIGSAIEKTATSPGAYAFLSLKDDPIPENTVQSDWNQYDNESPSYIKNKPDISLYAEKTVLQELVKKEDMLVDGDANNHDYVEIGGIKWATMNIGASEVTDSGLYFQWGDVQGYTANQVGTGSGQKPFTYVDYVYGGSNDAVFTKYNDVDNLVSLDISDDAANSYWGGNWRIPTHDDFIILQNATTYSYVENYNNSGVSGHLFVDKEDQSKKLFFPKAGWINNGVFKDTGPIYCTKDITFVGSPMFAAAEISRYSSPHITQNNTSRKNGSTIRAIIEKQPKYATNLDLQSLIARVETLEAYHTT